MSDGITDARKGGISISIDEYEKRFGPMKCSRDNSLVQFTTEFPLMTLPEDSNERKNVPIVSGCIKYFPAALAGVARISKTGNDKHNPGEPMHHARGKSTDHADCVVRHLIDVQDLIAAHGRGMEVTEQLLTEVSQLCWRALALSQELHEQFGAPLAPGAKDNK